MVKSIISLRDTPARPKEVLCSREMAFRLCYGYPNRLFKIIQNCYKNDRVFMNFSHTTLDEITLSFSFPLYVLSAIFRVLRDTTWLLIIYHFMNVKNTTVMAIFF